MKNIRADEKYLTVLHAPSVTEKTNAYADDARGAGRQFVFKVSPDATKVEVARAVSKIFSVDVVSVRIHNRKGKRGRVLSRGKHAWHGGNRQAYVRVAAGQDINLSTSFGS